MNRKLISSILIVTLMNLVGCYSFQNLSKEEQEPDFPLEQHSIKIFLNNGDDIYSNAYNHTIVRKASNYVVGSGIKYEGTSKNSSEFKGKILRNQIDSSKAGERYFIYWLNDNSRILFEKGKYIDNNPSSETGLWIAVSGGYEKINFNEFEEIQVYKINTFDTTVAIVFFVGLVVALVALAAFGSAMSN